MKSVRYRNDAKLVLAVGLALCALAAAIYGLVLLLSDNVTFEWEYIAIDCGLALIFILISLWMFCISCGYARREKEEEEVIEDLPATVVEEEPACIDLRKECKDNSVSYSCYLSMGTNVSVGGCPKKVKAEVDSESVKKVAKIAIPVIAAAACVTATAVAVTAANSEKRKQARRRRDFYRWLG